ALEAPAAHGLLELVARQAKHDLTSRRLGVCVGYPVRGGALVGAPSGFPSRPEGARARWVLEAYRPRPWWPRRRCRREPAQKGVGPFVAPVYCSLTLTTSSRSS